MKLDYRPEIDGLRAVAVVPVILFHVGFETFSGGYSGVDVFFVISGYLITSIIYHEFLESKFSIVRFYERRARRILPLLFFILLISIPFAWASLHTTDMVDFFQSLIAVPTFSSNFLFVNEANYFDTSVDLKPLLHTWSLAIEEQYYILFPLMILVFFSFIGKIRLLPALSIMCFLSFGLALWASNYYPEHNFYLLPTRFWELAAGAILGILTIDENKQLSKIKEKQPASEILSVIGLILIISGVFIIKKETPFPNYYALFPVIGTALVIAFASKENFTGKLLSTKPLIFVGLISYSAYMWHHPLFAFAKHLSLPVQSFTERIALCLLVLPLSYLTWKFVENPFRNRQKISKKLIFRFSIIGSIFFILVGFTGISNNGFPNRDICKKYLVSNYIPDNRKLQTDSWKELNRAKTKLEILDAIPDGQMIYYLSNSVNWFDDNNSLPNLLLIGNSHSKDIYNILIASNVATENFEIGQINLAIRDVKDKGHSLFSSPSYNDADIIMIASRYNYEDLSQMDALAGLLVSDGKQVVIVREIHNFKIINKKTEADLIIQKSIRQGINLKEEKVISDLVKVIDKAYFEDFNSRSNDRKEKSDQIIDGLSIKHPELIVLDRMKYLCDYKDERCYAINSKVEKYFYDDTHHTVAGAAFFGERVDKIKWLDPLLSSNSK